MPAVGEEMYDLDKIIQTLDSLWSYRYHEKTPINRKQKSIDFIHSLGVTACHAWPIRSTTMGKWKVFTIQDTQHHIWHNLDEPNRLLDTGEIAYFLFDIPFTQQEWFDLLDLSPEDQLAHQLRWGMP